MADRFPCVDCRKDVAATKNGRYRTHTTGNGDPCEMSSVPIPEHVLANGPVDGKTPADVPVEGVDYQQCPQCDRKVKLTRLGYFEPHDQTLRGGDRCPVGGVRAIHARKTEDVPLPGDEKPRPLATIPQVTSPAPISTNADAAGIPLELPPTSGGAPELSRESTGSSATTTTAGSEIDWSDIEGRASASGSSAVMPQPVDWSKVGDLKHLSSSESSPAPTSASETPNPDATPVRGSLDTTAEERVAALPDVSVKLEGELIYSGPESARPAGSPVSTEASSPPASTSWSSTSDSSSESQTPSLSPDTSSDAAESPADAAPFSLGVPLPGPFLQPFSPFSQPSEWIPPTLVFLQPPEYSGPEKPEPMGDLAKELATKIKETFYAYSNRKTTDNRSAQTTLGPSEIGTPCDRRLAMALLGVPPVNPGGDGWAAFVGTCTHVGMADVYTFADAGTGRYAVELPVFTGTPTVPRGTTDLLDRRDGTVVDWKVMGAYSLKKFKLEGPSATYRTQAHVYGYGAERAGEKVRNVAIVALPRAGSSLDEMHVWTEKYDRKLAEAALARVERIAEQVHVTGQAFQLLSDAPARQLTPMERAAQFDTADDCRWCSFHLKNDKEMKRGCPGK